MAVFLFFQWACYIMQPPAVASKAYHCKDLLGFCILPCLAFYFSFFFIADTSCFADQVSVDRKTLLRIKELCHSHAGPRRSGKRDCQAITSKAASHKFLLTQSLSFCNKSDALKLNVSFSCDRIGWCLISFTNEKLALTHSNKT